MGPANTGGSTHIYGRKLLYNVAASWIVPHITTNRDVDHAIFLVANSAFMCELERCEPLDNITRFFSELLASLPA